MTNKEQILNEIKKTKLNLANMEKMLEDKEWEEKVERWKPKTLGCYYFVTDNLTVARENFEGDYDTCKYNAYNCFQSREQAEAEAEKILIRRQLEDIARRLNRGRKIDWDNGDQRKYFISFNYWEDMIELEGCLIKKYQGVIYCLDENFLDVALKEIGEQTLKKYLKGE